MNLLKTLFKNRDRRVSVIMFVFAIVWLIMARNIKSVYAMAGSTEPGSRMFPYIIGTVLVLTSIGKFITCNQDDETPFYENYKGWLKAFAVLALLAVHVWLFPILGFPVSTFITGVLCVLLLKGDRKVRWFSPILFSGILTAVMYVLFVVILSIVMPTGSLWKLF